MKIFLRVLMSLLVTVINASLKANGCFQLERDALLTFKNSLNDPGNLTSSWHGQDCCNWSGVTCDQLTKHVVKLNLRNPYVQLDSSRYPYASDYYSWNSNAFTGEINRTLLSLRYLTHLDLSNHQFLITIPEFIGSFENLVYLNLSFSSFWGVIPKELGNLSRLQFLDLGGSIFSGMIPPQLGNLSNLQYLSLYQSCDPDFMPDIGNLSWLYRLSNLRYLDMTWADLNIRVDWSAINKMHLLETLSFSNCNLSEVPIESSHVNLTSLKKLDISSNAFHDMLPNWLWNLTNLLHLDLSNSAYHGSLPSSLLNMVSLNYLSLGANYFEHTLLEPISKLHNLRSLDLSSLEIGGDISNLIERLGSIWYNLEVVHLNSNNLSGNISNWIAQMKNISILDLGSNLLSGHIPSEIGTLAQLKELYLNDNSLSGDITENHFVNLTNLNMLDLSGNNMLTVNMDDKWMPPFQLKSLSLSSCKVGPSFPSWLQGQMQLRSVQLSNTSIFGAIPTWFWDSPLGRVDLSYNKINNWRGFNKVSDSIPSSRGTLESLDLSNNQINGSILHDICELKGLAFLYLSNNAIHGEIPICWNSFSSIITMDLSNNQITGQLPSSIGSWQSLTILHLDNNKLHGEISSTWQQCNWLLFLSLGRNKFSGKIPSFGKQCQNLVVLQLRSNKFTGFIPPELGELSYLQILDLSGNSLVGPLPTSVGNFYGMKNTSSQFFSSSHGFGIASTYDGTLYIDINGQQNYTSKPLYFTKMIDISGNNLSGQVPKEIWLLQGLIYLNLSKNNFMGEIPEIISGMGSLEFLDLSFNNFSGSIPQALSSLSSLHNLNLSYNNFSGKIPTGRQLDTISVPSVYVGNPYLCGPLDEKNCYDIQVSRGMDSTHDDNRSETVWFYLAVFLGFILGLWSVWGVLFFLNAWKTTYFQMIDALFDKMCVYIVLAVR